MEYQNYEDYMRTVLGYNPTPNNIYSNNVYNNRMNEYYEMPYDTAYMDINNNEHLNDCYPESYRMIYPMVCKVCNQYGSTRVTDDMLESMVDNIYRNIEPEDNLEEESRVELKNGDVRNPNAKQEVKKETRQTNFFLRDLIKVLLIREFLGNNKRPPVRPPRPMPGPGPGRPPFPGGFMPGGPFNY